MPVMPADGDAVIDVVDVRHLPGELQASRPSRRQWPLMLVVEIIAPVPIANPQASILTMVGGSGHYVDLDLLSPLDERFGP